MTATARRVPPQTLIEILAREVKVLKIVSTLPRCRYRTQAARLAAALAALPQSDRDLLAQRARVGAPSQMTWDAVCDTVRANIVPSEPFTVSPKEGG